MFFHETLNISHELNNNMADKDLKLETKCYDANEFGYLYGLNKRIPDEEFEKVKPYMRNFRRKD